MTFESEAQVQKTDEPESPKAGRADRKLGDEWESWDGTPEGDIDETKGRFVLLASMVCGLAVVLFLVGAYLVQPRLEEWPVAVQWTLRIFFFGLLVGGVCCYVLLVVEVLTGKPSLLPYRWSENMLLWLLPKAVWVGKKLGLSRDRVCNSFIKANNALTRSHSDRIPRRRLLILLPRCLSKTTRQEIRRYTEGHPYAVATVGGGEEARKVIRQERPSFIIALACERDLVSGIRDVALHIPVLGIANKRPEGPCKNTFVDMEEFGQAIAFFENVHPAGAPSGQIRP